jgi:hypothetical protein
MVSPGFVEEPHAKGNSSRQARTSGQSAVATDHCRQIDFLMKSAINPGTVRIIFLMISMPCLPSGESCLMRAPQPF